MAPPADPPLPPAPPVPDDELSPPRRTEPSKAVRAGRSDPDSVEAERSIVTVRFNRRLGWWLVSIGYPMFPAMLALGIYLRASHDIENSLLSVALSSSSLYAALMSSILILAPKNCLTYDVRRGWVGSGADQVQRGINRWRDGDRLEYSIYLGRLEIVRANGRRRGLVRNSFILDRDTWTAFVDVFLAHQNARAEDRQDTGLSREDREPSETPAGIEPAVRVGVRWRFFAVVILGGLALTALNVAIWADTERHEGVFDLFGPLAFLAAGYLLFGVLPLICNPVLTYESGTGRLTVKTRGLPAREFPRRGYERLEYSVYNGILYEVRADGKRRRVATGWARDQVAWKAFVDRFLQDRPTAESRSTPCEER